jgi:hypothetical protein
VAVVTSLRSPSLGPALPPPTDYDIEAVIQEDYINRSMESSMSTLPSPLPIVAAHLDVRPGGQGEFTAKVRVGSFEPTIKGVAIMRATAAGQLQVQLADVRFGYVPVTIFVPQGPIDELNEAINVMMAERMGPLEARVIGVGGDETTLRFYLVADM